MTELEKKDLKRRIRNLKQNLSRRIVALKSLIKEENDMVLKQILIDEQALKLSSLTTLQLYKVK